MPEITIQTASRIEFVDITQQVQRLISDSQMTDGLALVYCPHTTAALTINENADPDVVADIQRKLAEWAPQHDGYLHREGNSDAHIKASLLGSSQTLIVTKGRLKIGTWQGLFFCEFDGPRRRRVWVQLIPAKESAARSVNNVQ